MAVDSATQSSRKTTPIQAATASWRESGSIRRSGPDDFCRLVRIAVRTSSSSMRSRSDAGA
jgi:hypothetical protein